MRWLQLTFPTMLLIGCAVNPVPTPAAPQATGATADAGPTDDDGNKAADAVAMGMQDAMADAARADAQGAPIVGTALAPTATDPAIDPQFGDHWAIAKTATTGTGKLVVFLPGTGGQPKHYTALLHEAATLGHRALGLAYPNQPSLFELCGEDANCYEFARHEIFDGQDRSPKVTIKPADCIQNRLIKALATLDKLRPGEGWGSFASGTTPVWSKVIVAGHSQGAGHAAFIAKVNKVLRVGMFAGVVDATTKGPAAWVNNLHATPTAAYFGFVHTQDPAYARIAANWTALGMGASWVDVDASKPPWTSGQGFVTNQASDNPHGVVATGKGYAAVWRAVLGL
jgi:hypothetical protein